MAALDLVGRNDDLVALRALVDRGARLVTLLGPPGVGKTSLARAFVEPWRVNADGYRVITVDAAKADDEQSFVLELGRALETGQPVKAGPIAQQIVSASLTTEPTLLFIDNLDELAEPLSTFLTSLLDADGELVVLITSRRALASPLEHIFEISPLPCPGSLAELEASPAAELFLRTAMRKRRHFALADEDKPVLLALLQRLEGIPLAIELGAARLATLSLAGLLERLDESRAVLTRQSGDARHNSLATAYAGMVSSLDSATASAFAQASIFRGGFSARAFEAVVATPGSEASVDLLPRLIERSLVVSDPMADARRGDRFRLLESARERALQMTAERGDLAALRRRHRVFFAGVAREVDAMLDAGRLGDAVALESAEHRELEAALDETSESGETEASLVMLAPLIRASRMSMRPYAYARWYEPLRDAAPDSEAGVTLRAALLVSESFSTPAAEVCRRARAILARQAPSFARAQTRTILGAALVSIGHIDEARTLLSSAGHDVSDQEVALSKLELSNLERTMGNTADALRYAEAVLATLPPGRDPMTAINALINLSLIHLDAGDKPAAARRIEQGLARAHDVGLRHSRMIWVLHVAQARLAHLEGKLGAAQLGYRAAEKEAQAIGIPMLGLIVSGYDGVAMLEQGRVADGADRIREALALSGSVEPGYEAFLRAMLALAELTRGALDTASELLDQAETKVPVGAPMRRVFEACRGAAERVGASRARESGDVVRATELEASARSRLAQLFDRPKELGLFELVLTERLLSTEPRLSVPPAPNQYLVMASDGRWFTPPAGARVVCGRRPVMRRMLVALAEKHIEAPGRSVGGQELVSLGWPDERMGPASARRRLQVMMSRMRELGLREVIQTTDDGYRIDPDCVVRLRDE